MSNKSGVSSQIISIPKGGGALQGIGETFSPDLHTGTGNFSFPIALPPGRNGFQPHLNLAYSTGNGNGYFGLGWNISMPGVNRKTSQGIPRYNDNSDTFVLSGAEDLVAVAVEKTKLSAELKTRTSYRPRTEGLFAHIDHYYIVHKPASGQNYRVEDYWQVCSKDGLISYYGTPEKFRQYPNDVDKAALLKPGLSQDVFAWKLSRTVDTFGNWIEYSYLADSGNKGAHQWNQPLLNQICYTNYTDKAGQPQFLVTVTFTYEDRPDTSSEYRAGFEICTSQRCREITIETHANQDYKVRTYQLHYERDRMNGTSLLHQVQVVGYGDDGKPDEGNGLPPLKFGYTTFEPKAQQRKFLPITGGTMPSGSLGRSEYELADLTGDGLPDLLEMNGTTRYWSNLGGGKFDLPRRISAVPAGLTLADPGIQLIDADGDARIDLLVTKEGMAGYFPLCFESQWDRRSFQPYQFAPSFSLKDPEVKLVDLDGDGVTDAIRSGTRFECFFNHRQKGWTPGNSRRVERKALDVFPNVNFSDPRVKWADMSGDGLQDIVLVYDRNIEYWPNLGYGNWGKRIQMAHCPAFPYGYDPKRILIGDVDGDGLADLVYVEDNKVTLWINQSGNGWGEEPIVVEGTPSVTDMDAVRLVDMLGCGTSGILWSCDATNSSRPHMFFLDFTGGTKPYVLNKMDNLMGAITKVEYSPSTHFYLADRQDPQTRWKTSLPFPVQVVSRVEIFDEISKGKLTTEYKYHHGYWDGVEREFRGFGMVEQFDTETFGSYIKPGLTGETPEFIAASQVHFSPPTCTKTWFHQGPVGNEAGEWQSLDLSAEYWPGDRQLLNQAGNSANLLKDLATGRVRRDALRTLRGKILRTELYALDDTELQGQPYTITEFLYGIREETPSGNSDGESNQQPIFFPHLLAQRTTRWERGDDPLTHFSFTGSYDEFGQPLSQTEIAMPRRKAYQVQLDVNTVADEIHVLAVHQRTVYAQPTQDSNLYLPGRVTWTTSFAHSSPGVIDESLPGSVLEVLQDHNKAALALHNEFEEQLRHWKPEQHSPSSVYEVFAHTVNRYDGQAYQGLDPGFIGSQGVLTSSETLGLTAKILSGVYMPGTFTVTGGNLIPGLAAPNGFDKNLGYREVSAENGYVPGIYYKSHQQKYDFQDSTALSQCGLIIGQKDALDKETTIRHDDYALLPVSVHDPIGLVTTAEYNYRLLQPARMTGPNGNWTEIRYSSTGLPVETWLKGKNGEGDLSRPSLKIEYDFLAFQNSPAGNRQPIYGKTQRYEFHDTDPDDTGMLLETHEYSDGFGRLLQTRTQGEAVRFGDPVFGGSQDFLPTNQNDGYGGPVTGSPNLDEINPNVVVSGWQVYNNKGLVVEKYEPFFSVGWEYAQPVDTELGWKATLFYDPRGQVIRTLNSDGSEQRVIYGIPKALDKVPLGPLDSSMILPTPWEVYTYDANDLAPLCFDPVKKQPHGSPLPLTDQAPSHHHFTPASKLTDGLGRTLMVVERNRPQLATPAAPLPAIKEYRTLSSYDIRGNLLNVTDALNRLAYTHSYDLANRLLQTGSIDAGSRISMLNAAGQILHQQDSKGAVILRSYDAASRLSRLWAQDGAGQPLTLREKLVYGDDPQAGLSQAQVASGNLLGMPYQHYDEAGLLTFTAYDFKNTLLQKTRQVIAVPAILAAFEAPSSTWEINPFRANWEPVSATPLAASYRTEISYDALGRVKRLQYPDNVMGKKNHLVTTYNRAGTLERVSLDSANYIEHIAYNARGQRILIAYGNGVMTRYSYDEFTLRLARLRTERYTKLAAPRVTYQPASPAQPLQDFAYKYDLAGNMVALHDRTPESGLSTQPDQLDRTFTYDPLYRLLSATGRECNSPPPPNAWDDTPKCTDYTRTRHYSENYEYDPAGNMTRLGHLSGANGSFTREFSLTPGCNRLAAMTVGLMPFNCLYDPNGNLIRETTSRHFEWDHSDRMYTYRTQAGSSEPSVHAQYLYDATGQRVMKFVRHQGGAYEVTIYIEGVFEHYRWGNSPDEQNNTLHIMDNQSRLALVRVGQASPDDGAPALRVKYHLGDHLGSSSVVIGGADSNGNTFINREEYLPYGETSFGSFGRKCYRFTGKERDEESGLNYHGARYYSPWLARWNSCDPLLNGINSPYSYARGAPLRLIDPGGAAEIESQAALGPKEPELNLVRGPYTDVGGHHSQGQSAFKSPQTGKDPFRGQVTTTSQVEGDLTGERHQAASNFQNSFDRAVHGKSAGTVEVGVTDPRTSKPMVTLEVIDTAKPGTLAPGPSPDREMVKSYYAWRSTGAPREQALNLTLQDVNERATLAANENVSPLPTRAPGSSASTPQIVESIQPGGLNSAISNWLSSSLNSLSAVTSGLDIIVWTKEVGEKGFTNICGINLVFDSSKVPNDTRFENLLTGDQGHFDYGEMIIDPI